jgi:hypothetical protein
MLGDSIVSWRGPCDIAFSDMVDGEDLLANAKIAGSDMIHFIIEKFDCDLYAGVALQRLLTSLAIDVLKRLSPSTQFVNQLHRAGDDIFYHNKKLSISIATKSMQSILIHFAVNVTNIGTPVPTLSLQDLEVEPKVFAEELMTVFSCEVDDIIQATRKVKTR